MNSGERAEACGATAHRATGGTARRLGSIVVRVGWAAWRPGVVRSSKLFGDSRCQGSDLGGLCVCVRVSLCGSSCCLQGEAWCVDVIMQMSP